MYITAMWVQAPNKDLGTNIIVHPGFSDAAQVNGPLTLDAAERVVANPSPDDKGRGRVLIPRRMNRVFAHVDIVLDDRQPLDDLAEPIRRALQAHDPATDEWAAHEGVFIRFFNQPYMAARADTYGMLRAQLGAWLDATFPPRLAAAG